MTTNDCATITWTINNFRYCWQKNDEAIVSPVFCIKMPEETKWKILLYPRGVALQEGSISLFLYRDTDCCGSDEIEVEYNLDIVDNEGFGAVDSLETVKFRRDMKNGYPRYIHRQAVVTTKLRKWLPNGNLTIRCEMFQCDGEIIEKQKIFARTVIGFEKRFLSWIVDDFGTMLSDQPGTFFMKSKSKDEKMEVTLSVTGDDNETILFGMDMLDPSEKYIAVKTFIINSENDEVDSGEYEYWFGSESCRMFPLKFTRSRLMRNKSDYLPNNALTLSFELTVTSGFAFQGLEKAAPECHPMSSVVIENCRKCNAHEKIIDCPCALVTDLAFLHKDPSSCDMHLETQSVVIKVHSLILSARSPVFKALISNEMKEKTIGSIYVPDISDDILRQFILYLYSDQLEDLKWDDAEQLYEAADKYVVNSLRIKCCMHLKNNLNLGNACRALVFSDLHQEKELKEFVQNFMLKNAKIIFKSEEWKDLVESNAKLAVETTLRYWNHG